MIKTLGISRIAMGVDYPKATKIKRMTGIEILHHPIWNKGLNFDESERDRLGIRGLIPSTIQSLKYQVDRSLRQIRGLSSDIKKNLYLQDLKARNETIFHKLLQEHVS